MNERRELVTKERRARLTRFAKKLADLCDEFQVDLIASPEAVELIEVIERDFRYPEGYSFSALFTGVDKRGAFNTCNAKDEERSGFSIDRWECPE
jgi:hypothetical protein